MLSENVPLSTMFPLIWFVLYVLSVAGAVNFTPIEFPVSSEEPIVMSPFPVEATPVALPTTVVRSIATLTSVLAALVLDRCP
jgi:hypothetical protein